MNEITTKALVNAILEKAKDGVYRNDILHSLFYDTFTKDEIKLGILIAKQRGMYSIADMRTNNGGTYYQFDGEITGD